MSAQVLENTKLPFYSTKVGGRQGLGLVLCREIVEAHDGSCGIRSPRLIRARFELGP